MKKLLLLVVVCGVVSACETQSRFYWGDYETRLYKYYKNPENRAAYQASLEKVIEKGEASNKVAPGMNAELGFLALEDGDKARAEELFLREKVLFPESAPFMDSIIKRMNEQDEPPSSDEDGDMVS